MGDAILVTKDLTKKYGRDVAVNHVSITVNRGDIYGFIGVNGAGKTTFIRMVCGLVKPAEGGLELYGASSGRKLQAARKKLGALIEHPAIYSNLTARENLEVQRRYLGMRAGKGADKEIEELLELVGLEDVGSKRAGAFSMEMKQRLGLAVALAGAPGFLILDEPAAGLNPAGVVELRTLLLKLHAEKGLTIFFSNQDLSEMECLATRYGFLEKGRLVKEVTAQELERECSDRKMDREQYFQDLLKQARQKR